MGGIELERWQKNWKPRNLLFAQSPRIVTCVFKPALTPPSVADQAPATTRPPYKLDFSDRFGAT